MRSKSRSCCALARPRRAARVSAARHRAGAAVRRAPKVRVFRRCVPPLPLLAITGLAMSPAVTAAYPFIASVWGGSQSARTIHFFAFALVAAFTIGHC